MWYRVKWNSTSIKIAIWWWTFLHARERKHKRNASSSYILNIYHHRGEEHIEWWKRYVWWWSTLLLLSFELMRIKKKMLNGKSLYHCPIAIHPTLECAHSFHFICLLDPCAVNSKYLWTNFRVIFSLFREFIMHKEQHVSSERW